MQALHFLIQSRMRDLNLVKLEEFAVYAHIGRATVFNLLKETASTPSLKTLFKLEKALDKPIAELAELYRPQPARQEILASLRGKYKTSGRKLVDELLEQRRNERAS
jgi:transcriptional regulator with XRE-family HTH domain